MLLTRYCRPKAKRPPPCASEAAALCVARCSHNECDRDPLTHIVARRIANVTRTASEPTPTPTPTPNLTLTLTLALALPLTR